MLTAIAWVLQLIEISVPFLVPGFIKFDLSDLPALIGAFSLGPWWGVFIQLAKNLLHLPFFVGSSYGVGELSNFLLGGVFVLIAGLVYHHRKTRKTAIAGAAIGAVCMALVSMPLNYFVVYPLYFALMIPKAAVIEMYTAILQSAAYVPTADPLFNCLLIFNVPFTLVKGLLNVLICYLIYKPLSKTVLSKELLSEEKTMNVVDLRKKKRNLWILTGAGILLVLIQALLWAVELFPETFAFATHFAKLTGAMSKLLSDADKSWLLKAAVVLAFHAVGVAGALCVILGAVNLRRLKKRNAENAPEDANSAE
jgi:riboflavin transporter FmnP